MMTQRQSQRMLRMTTFELGILYSAKEFTTICASLDIIKSGGYKISALDIERQLLGLPYITEAMAVGVADPKFGQRFRALITLREQDGDTYFSQDGVQRLAIDSLRKDLRTKLSPVQVADIMTLYGIWRASSGIARAERYRRALLDQICFLRLDERHILRCKYGRRMITRVACKQVVIDAHIVNVCR